MSTDDDVTGRDLRTIWRTLAIVGALLVIGVGALVAGVQREIAQDVAIRDLQKWQAEKDAEAKEAARRERWRQFRQPAPSLQPQSGITRREVSVRIVEVEGERFAILAERDLLGIVSAADELADELTKRKACGWL